MSDILDQDEVNALLDIVEKGKLDVSATSDVEESAEVYLYDFKRPERVSKDQMRALENLHEIFARNFSATLSSYLRTIADIKLISVEQLTYSEFVLSLPNPTCFNLLSADLLEGDIILELNPSIVYPVLDRLVGGTLQTADVPDRPISEVEWAVVSKVIEKGLVNLSSVWSNVREISFAIKRQETNPQLMQVVAPNEPVVLICFEVNIGEISGLMNLCLPFVVIEPVMGDLNPQAWFGYSRGDAEGENRMKKGIERAEIEVVCSLAKTEIDVSHLLNLKAGDVLHTSRRMESDVLLSIDGKPKFWGKPGQIRGKKAFRIVREARGEDTL
ncbi:MAG: flagellar motor switch protein FliM [Planctomycetota bacterium]|jgi:flagellar motor switch protein FliM|nr:flagellar motor switch protein FliM [Planctomycetota bacterium]